MPPFTSVVAAFGRQLSDGEITSTLGHTLGSFGIASAAAWSSAP